MKYCIDNSEFYAAKFKDSGADIKDVKTLDDFRRLPIFMDKEIDRLGQEESRKRFGHPFGLNLCTSQENVIGIHSTSGTTGLPTFYAFTKHDIKVNNEGLARAYWRVGIRPGDVVIHGFGLSMWLGGLPLLRAFEYMGVRAVPVGIESGTERFILYARLNTPKHMVCTPSFAEYLIRRAPEVAGIEVRELGIKKIVTLGEPGAGLPEVRKKIEEAYGCKLYDGSGGIWGLMKVSCDAKEYQGMHNCSEDFLPYFDIVDPNTKEPLEIKDEVIGEFVATALEWEASPL